MPRFNPIYICTFILVALFALATFVSVFLVQNRLDNQFYGSKLELLLKSYEGDITVKNNNFNILIITLKNPNLENQESISFKLLENDQMIRELQFSGANVGDPSDVRLQFAPIPDSAGKIYRVKLATAESSKPLSVFVGDDGEFAYRTYFRSTNKVLALKNFTTSFISRLFTDVAFFGIWTALVISIAVLHKRRDRLSG